MPIQRVDPVKESDLPAFVRYRERYLTPVLCLLWGDQWQEKFPWLMVDDWPEKLVTKLVLGIPICFYNARTGQYAYIPELPKKQKRPRTKSRVET